MAGALLSLAGALGPALPAAAAEPAGGLGGEAWLGAWLAVFAASYALYAHERARRPAPGRPARESGSLRPSVSALFTHKPPRPAPAEAAPAPRPARPRRARPARSGAASRVRRCAELRAAGRLAEAARTAREGLATARETGPLLLELSRAEYGLGHAGTAIDVARDAHFASRSRESAEHLIRLLVLTRRFERGDGPSLRRAVLRHPREPVLQAAAGVFEASFGKRADAELHLHAALALGPDPELRAAIARVLALVAECAGAGEA